MLRLIPVLLAGKNEDGAKQGSKNIKVRFLLRQLNSY